MLTIRRREFADEAHETACAILDATRYAQLATTGPEGEPQIRPMNYARVADTIYLHCAQGGSLHAQAGRAAVLSAVEQAVWLPSYWRHPEMACPATTWYRSVQVRGRLRAVEAIDEKARALDAFMRRYQPEGGHVPMDAARYVGPLRALTVLALPLEQYSSKVKVGQHLTADVRDRMRQCLEARGQDDDWDILRTMARANGESAAYPCEDGRLRWTDDPADVPLDPLHALLDRTYWAAGRPLAVVADNLRRATLTLTAHDGNRLVAHARVVVAHPKVAWLFDVVIHEDYRGNGLGRALMTRVLAHRSVRAARRVFLDTRDAMPLYRKFGFVELKRSEERQSSLMVLERG